MSPLMMWLSLYQTRELAKRRGDHESRDRATALMAEVVFEHGCRDPLDCERSCPVHQAYTRGDRVRHCDYGPGQVLSRYGPCVDVLFDRHGVKQVDLRVLPMWVER